MRPSARTRRAQAAKPRQRLGTRAAAVLEANRQLGVLVEAGGVDLEVSELGGDGGLHHLHHHPVVHGHGEHDAGDSHGHGRHHDGRPPDVAPGQPQLEG